MVGWDGQAVPWLEEGEPLKHPLIDLVRDIEAEAAPIMSYSVEVTKGRRTGTVGRRLEAENGATILRPCGLLESEYEKTNKPREEGIWFEILWMNEEEESAEKKRHAEALKISDEEVKCLYHLLSNVFNYRPEDLISTDEIEKHEWFVKEFPYAKEIQ